MIEREPLSVSELNARIKGLIESDPVLGSVYVRGELSNYKVYPSGHHYFTLKDAESSLRCVMFRSAASKLRFRPESGMGVTVCGRVSVYPRDGAYQLYCEELIPEGAGTCSWPTSSSRNACAGRASSTRRTKSPSRATRSASRSSPPPRARPYTTSSGSCASAGPWRRSCCCPCGCRAWRPRRR